MNNFVPAERNNLILSLASPRFLLNTGKSFAIIAMSSMSMAPNMVATAMMAMAPMEPAPVDSDTAMAKVSFIPEMYIE